MKWWTLTIHPAFNPYQKSSLLIKRTPWYTLHALSFVRYRQHEGCYLNSSISTHVSPHFPISLPYAVSKHIKLSLTLKYTKITLARDINHPLHTLPFTHSDTPQKTLPYWRVTLSCTHPQTLHNLTCITLTRTHMHTSAHIKSSGL